MKKLVLPPPSLWVIPPPARARIAYQVRLGKLADVDHWLLLTPRREARHEPQRPSQRLAARYRRHGQKLYLLVPDADAAQFAALMGDEASAQAWQGLAAYPVQHTPIDVHEARRAAALFRLPPAQLEGHQIMRFDRASRRDPLPVADASQEAEIPFTERRMARALVAVGAELAALVGVAALGARTMLKPRA